MKKRNPKKRSSRQIHKNPKRISLLRGIEDKHVITFGFGLIILLGIILYSNSFNCSFHLDDKTSIINNLAIRDMFDFKKLWNHSHGRFVAYFTFAINYHFHGLDVWGYHFINLLIHLINSVLVFWLSTMIFSSPSLKNNFIGKDKIIIAFIISMLFVSHPLATQSITYIVQRLACLVTLFYLLSCSLYMNARLREKDTYAKYLLYAGACISAVLALHTKENSYTLPFAIVLIELFFMQTKRISINFKDYRLFIAMMLFALLILFGPVNLKSDLFDPINPAGGNTFTITPVNYLLTQFSVIVKYIQLLILPLSLNLDYDFQISNSIFELRTLLSLTVLIAIGLLGIYLYKKQRLISFGIFWFFLTLSIESSFFPITDLIFEHRTYLPSFGFFLIIGYVLHIFMQGKYKNLAIAALISILGFYSLQTYQRNKVWKDEISLWDDVLKKSPNKARPYVNRGIDYWRLNEKFKALNDYDRAIEINPSTYSPAYNNRGVAYKDMGEFDKAISDYNKALEINPNFAGAYYNRGWIYLQRKQWNAAITDYSKAIELDPVYASAYFNRGWIYMQERQWHEAIADFSKTIEYNPIFANAYVNRGVSNINLGLYEKALIDLTKALELEPQNKNAQRNRDVAIREIGNKTK